MVTALRAQRERTGVRIPELVAQHLDPALGIPISLISAWVGGAVKTAGREHYEHVLQVWQGLPDREQALVFYTPAIRAAMDEQRHRTGQGIYSLVAQLTDMPDGLTLCRIKNFYGGRLETLPRPHVEYLLGKWKALPDRPETVPLTPEMVETLRAHAARTGKGPQALLAGARDRPQGLDSGIAAKWLRGDATMARKDHLGYILKRYEAHAQNSGVPARL